MAKQPTRSSGAFKTVPKRSTTSSRASSGRTKAPPPPTLSQRASDFADKALGGHGPDVGGLALIALGVIAGLGIYGDLVGPAGRVLADGTGAFLGLCKWMAPPALIILGIVLIRSVPRSDADPDETRPPDQTARLVVGCALLLVAATGLLHLVAGAPEWGDPVADFGDAGGYLGLATGGLLQAVLAVWGAALVLLTIALVALVVLSRVSVRVAAAAADVLGEADAEEAELAHALEDLARELFLALPLVGVRGQLLLDEITERLAEDVVLLAEERLQHRIASCGAALGTREARMKAGE